MMRRFLSSGSFTYESQIKAREEKLKRIERADKYGIPVSKLDTHEAYLTALKNYEKAKSGDELRASLNSLKALGNYLNSASLLSECDKKVKAIEEVERVEKSVADAKYALAVAEKELKEAEQDSQVSEQELMVFDLIPTIYTKSLCIGCLKTNDSILCAKSFIKDNLSTMLAFVLDNVCYKLFF